ncbi:hypothetical protein B0H66DRAFT_307843 [Apodospora peruviana]|uniref:GST N-terminal domain-containing protein n=1 Tax=Apodospora peruviana TaxID=516989 RepID=A0AAE0I1M2_9PEZI|nr:hypothetical protein B0H66DRAFT_307843 [Apodospora peruviana]
MESPSTKPNIILFDIAFAPPFSKNTCAPNPWKARYALNFKDVTYSTQWVQMPDITKTRKGLGVPPCRTLADGTEYYTLPIVTDATTGSAIGDSFDIATHLQDTYPSSGAGDLFPSPIKLDYVCPIKMTSATAPPLTKHNDERQRAEYARFNNEVDTAFTAHVGLMVGGMRWDPALEGGIKAEFVRRAGAKRWEDLLVLESEAREKLIGSLRETLRDLAALYYDRTGPFLLGNQPSYADIIVGGWLRFASKTLLEGEWTEIQGWYDGVFGTLHDALQERFGMVR